MVLGPTLCSALFTLAAQAVGGDSETLFLFEGSHSSQEMGLSVSGAGDVNGDGIDDVIVGAPHADPPGLHDIGSASVFSGSDGTLLYRWFGNNYLDQFGFSVAAAGDLNADGFGDLLIGALIATPQGRYRAGSVYAYSGADGSLLHQWDGVTPEGWLGYSVSGAGDLDGDGFDDVLLGAPRAGLQTGRRGGVAVAYSGADGSMIHYWDWAPHRSQFGFTVSAAGDTNGDGTPDIIIGAPDMKVGSTLRAGSAFVYSGVDGSLLRRWDGTQRAELHGYAVSGAGDVNKDGLDDLLVSALSAVSGPQQDTGSVFVYSGADGWQIYRWNGDGPSTRFGHALAGAGDVDGDSFPDLLVGARFNDPGVLHDSGSAYLFSGFDGAMLHRWDGLRNFDEFGHSVAAAGDINGDGFSDLIIGAPNVRVGGFRSAGSAYVETFSPFLRSDTTSISASLGGTFRLDLDFPDAAAFQEYRVIISGTGSGPSHHGVDIPLTFDAKARRSYLGFYSLLLQSNLHGNLDALGDAVAFVSVAQGSALHLTGRTYWLAAIANSPGLLPEYSSVFRSIQVLP